MFKLLTIVLLCIHTVFGVFIDIVPEAHDPGKQLPGTPSGKIVSVGGIKTYVSFPKIGGPLHRYNKAVLLLSDIYGLPLNNTLLLADQFAAAGFPTYVPDYLLGDPVPLVQPPGWNMTEWRTRHGPAQTLPPLKSVIKALKDSGVKKLGATGYCFGGLYTMLLSQTNDIVVGTTAHPSGLSVPNDFLTLRNVSKVPFQILSAQNDGALTPTLAATVDEVLYGTGNYSSFRPYKPGYERLHFQGVGHGFAVRLSNATDPIQVAAKEAAFQGALKWIRKHI